jgi:outer membrane protein
VKRSVVTGVFMAALGLAVGADAAELKIGYVETARLMAEAPQAKAVNDALRSEFGPREREFQAGAAALKAREEKLQKDSATMSELQRSSADKELRDGYRDLQRKQAELQDDLNARQNEEIGRLQRVLRAEVDVFAKAQGYDLVLADGVLFASPAVNVTAPILAALQARKVSAGTPAPAKPAAKP